MDEYLRKAEDLLASWWSPLANWYVGLTPSQHFAFKSALLALWLLFALWLAHAAFRLVAGHRRFMGQWYSPDHWHRYMQELHTAEREGRALNYREAFALDEYRTGKKSRLRQLAQRDRSFN